MPGSTPSDLPSLPPLTRGERVRVRWEIWIVLAISVGQSALYSLLSFVRSILRALESSGTLADQQTTLNPTRDSAAFWDALYQLLSILFSLSLVAMVVYLLWEPGSNALRRIGLDFRRFGSDVGRGALLVVVIGVPGLALYAVGRMLGLTLQVSASPLDAARYTVPLLVLAAVRAALVEEVVFIGYLFDRLRRLGWSSWSIILTTAGLRGAYHAYQGVGAIVGNVAMGVVFGWCYRRWGRVMPLVVAHTLIDVVAFVGYPLAVVLWPGVFAPAVSPTPTPTSTATP
ncbi:CPBP family intramembrane glutamic endopeptidase [Microbacterium fluvii]|uniref:CPBP family intramembrane glutamic endopeptidase n=1 Tax=Microbacterium fluvii TaxID=415215 RepID=A0ABW2HDR3_9MICO|nr:CPBP family intramembrane glutamic endopeptidase [Microbacterium fluvii]MCU4672274.1 CPBP family intramembrane metalloprotease [Microbacterium fluvii]